MTITLIGSPKEEDWIEVKRRALVTAGKKNVINPPDSEWKHKILEARHSPIRYLRFSFFLEEVPYWVAMHLRTHVHDTPNGDEFLPYVKSQRDDRQHEYPRGKAPQDQPVNMIIDMSAEQLMQFANKRLCSCAASETRYVTSIICRIAQDACPELNGLLVPNCEFNLTCHEMFPCEKGKALQRHDFN